MINKLWFMFKCVCKLFLWTPVKNTIDFHRSDLSNFVRDIVKQEVMSSEYVRKNHPEWRTLKIAPGVELGFWVPPSFLRIEEQIAGMKDCESRTELIITHWGRISIFLDEAARNKDFSLEKEMRNDSSWFISKKGNE